MTTHLWTSDWVAGQLDIRLRTTGSAVGLEVRELVGLAVRRNARRVHLLVSMVLGKHVPTDPLGVYHAGWLLGVLAADALCAGRTERTDSMDRSAAGVALRSALTGDRLVRRESIGAAGKTLDALVLGYAETATALGHCVADALGAADYLHSTRRPVAGVRPSGGFEEEHSHASSHLMLPADPTMVSRSRPLVLVDDELSTGQTVLNTIKTLHRWAPRERYVVAALVDVRPPAQRALLAKTVAEMGARLDVVSLVDGELDLPGDLLARGAQLLTQLGEQDPAEPEFAEPVSVVGGPIGPLKFHVAAWPRVLPVGGRHGFTPAHRTALEAQLPGLVDDVLQAASPAAGARVLVLGSEELMYLPLRLAMELTSALPDLTVRFSTTTRSPVLAVSDDSYPIRHTLRFPAHDHVLGEQRFAYNVRSPGSPPWDVIVLVVDEVGDTLGLRSPDGLLASLRRHAHGVLTVIVPSGEPV